MENKKNITNSGKRQTYAAEEVESFSAKCLSLLVDKSSKRDVHPLEESDYCKLVTGYNLLKPAFMNYLRINAPDLTPRQTFYCICHHMHLSKAKIMQLTSVFSDGSYRSYKSKIKSCFLNFPVDCKDVEEYIHRLTEVKDSSCSKKVVAYKLK